MVVFSLAKRVHLWFKRGLMRDELEREDQHIFGIYLYQAAVEINLSNRFCFVVPWKFPDSIVSLIAQRSWASQAAAGINYDVRRRHGINNGHVKTPEEARQRMDPFHFLWKKNKTKAYLFRIHLLAELFGVYL